MVIDYYAGDDYARENVVEPLIAGIRQLGVPVFDECNDLLEEGGDKLLRENDYYVMSDTLKKSKYIVLVITKELLGDLSILVELDIINKLAQSGVVKVFAVLYGITTEDLPDRVKWLLDTNLIEVKDMLDAQWAALVIAEKFWYDKAICASVKMDWDMPNIVEYLKNSYVAGDKFVKELLEVYGRLDRHNYSKCMVVLILLNRYLCVKYPVLKLSKENQQCIKKMAETVYGSRAIGKREMNILACCVVDMLERVR